MREILILGNGFDIAHDLPTRYGEFLKFTEVFLDTYCDDMQEEDLKRVISNEDSLCMALFKEKEHYNEYYNLVNDNRWIEYFVEKQDELGDKWIDFETEMSNVIRLIDRDVNNYGLDADIRPIDDGLVDLMVTSCENVAETYQSLIEILYNDLGRLIRALEIYLVIVSESLIPQRIPEISDLNPDVILNFNYTNIYEKVYGSRENCFTCYIHGYASMDNSIQSNNMVLGIDEYLDGDNSSIQLLFVQFKKYFQRLEKHLGADYLMLRDKIAEDWNHVPKESREKYHNILCYPGGCLDRDVSAFCSRITIFGHSMGKTDQDVLAPLICNDNVQTIIYYYDQEAYVSILQNMIQLIGKEELLRRTGGKTRTIWFKEVSKKKESCK